MRKFEVGEKDKKIIRGIVATNAIASRHANCKDVVCANRFIHKSQRDQIFQKAFFVYMFKNTKHGINYCQPNHIATLGPNLELKLSLSYCKS